MVKKGKYTNTQIHKYTKTTYTTNTAWVKLLQKFAPYMLIYMLPLNLLFEKAVIPELQNNVSKCLTRKYTNTQVYKYTIQHKYTIRHKYSLVQIVAKSYALHVRLHLASKPNFLKGSDTRTSKQCF